MAGLFFHPPFDSPLMGNSSEFLDETYSAKTRGMGYRMVKIAFPNFNCF